MKEYFDSNQNSYETPPIRIVGDASEKIKQKTKEKFQGYFREKHMESVSKEKLEAVIALEYEKSRAETELIEAADNEFNDIMRKAEAEPFDVPPKNIHLIPPELYEKINRTQGDAITATQHRAIFINAEKYRNNPLDFGKTIFHELLHLKGHFAVEVEENSNEKEAEASVYRSGLSVFSSQKSEDEYRGHKHFDGLEEGLAGALERRYFQKMINRPILKEQKEWLESDKAAEIKQKISKDENIPIEEISNVKENGDFATFSYPFHGKVLNLLVSEIYEKNKDKFKSEDDVLNVFIKAHFDGKILPMSRLITETFDKDTLRAVSMMSDERDSAAQTLEFLEKKARN